jgi:hypothetical protein
MQLRTNVPVYGLLVVFLRLATLKPKDWSMKQTKISGVIADEVASLSAKGDLSKELQEAWDKYDDTGEYTIYDLVGEIEFIANNNSESPIAETLKEVVEAFREEEKYDHELAGRGDMDTAEENLVQSIKFVLSHGKAQSIG